MTILSDGQIKALCVGVLAERAMIAPFLDHAVKADEQGNKIISKGLSSYGYDVSLSDEFKIFTNLNSSIIDPKRFDERCLVNADLLQGDNGERYVLLPPNSYLLCRTNEYFNIPRDVMIVVLGKSTYARAGCLVNTTPIEPGFCGNVVIEISNATTLPLKIYANEGIAQFLFFQGSVPCEVSYADRAGKYMNQTGIQNSLV